MQELPLRLSEEALRSAMDLRDARGTSKSIESLDTRSNAHDDMTSPLPTWKDSLSSFVLVLAPFAIVGSTVIDLIREKFLHKVFRTSGKV